jgi:hypothetical protein
VLLTLQAITRASLSSPSQYTGIGQAAGKIYRWAAGYPLMPAGVVLTLAKLMCGPMPHQGGGAASLLEGQWHERRAHLPLLSHAIFNQRLHQAPPGLQGKHCESLHSHMTHFCTLKSSC